MDRAEEVVKKAKIQLLIKHPFYGMLVLGLEETWGDKEISTCGVVPGRMYLSREFFSRLTVAEATAVMAHEACHLGLLHPFRRRSRGPFLWNMAADHAVNLLLQATTRLELPPPHLADPRFTNMTAEQVYEVLLGEAQAAIKQAIKEGKVKLAGRGQGIPTDELGLDEETRKALEDALGKNFDQHPWDKATEGMTKEEIEQAEAEMKENIVRAAAIARSAGSLPGQWEGIIADMLRPKIDWRARLRDFVQGAVKSDYRLSPPNKRHLHLPVYLPSLAGEHLEIAVALDTSGSVSDSDLAQFTAEVRGITEEFDSYRIRYYQCDANIAHEAVIEPGDPTPVRMHGRGGTDFGPVFEKVKGLDGISCLIYLTDGYPNNGWPDPLPGLPTLWVICTDVVPPWGETVRLEVNEDR